MESAIQYITEWDDSEQSYVRFARLVSGGKVVDLPAESLDMGDSYVQVASANYEPEVTVTALMQTGDYDAVKFVPQTLTVTSTRIEPREFDTEFDANTTVAFAKGGKGHIDPETGKWVVDVYGDPAKALYLPNDPPDRNLLHGYTLLPAADKIVRCWYCNCDFSYREFVNLMLPRWQEQDDETKQRAFCMEMLLHFSDHREANDLPFVTTYFAPQVIYRPDGSIAASKPGVVRTWKVNGGLLGFPSWDKVASQQKASEYV